MNRAILLIGNDISTIEEFKTILTENGYYVDTALNGREALSLLSKNNYGISFISDPDDNTGLFDLVERIRRISQNIVILTDNPRDASDMSITYLRMPLSADSLLHAVQHGERNKDLKEQNESLKSVNKYLEGYLSIIKHDLRSPIINIIQFADLLEKHHADKLNEDGREIIHRIYNIGQKTNRLLNDLFHLIDISKKPNCCRNINSRQLVDWAIERNDLCIKEKKVDIHIQDNMPPIHCDPAKISEVFFYLISNSIKFSSPDKPIEIQVGYFDRENCYEFYVKDNGIGIAPNHHEKIFKLFYRLNPRSAQTGSGAGLHIAKRIVEGHGGKIRVDSAIGKGATFFFTLTKK